MGAGDPERPRELARSGEIGLPAVERFRGTDQDRLAAAGLSGNDVEHLVHSVDEIHIGMARRAEHDFSPPGSAFGRVGRKIVRSDIGFCFHDAGAVFSAPNAADENGADEASRDPDRVLLIKRSIEFFHDVMTEKARIIKPEPRRR